MRITMGAVVDKHKCYANFMKLDHCKLLRKQQLKLVEYFVLEVTARSVANLLGIQPNSAA